MIQLTYDVARPADREGMISHINALKRGVEWIEIADAALFLASGEGCYASGHALIIDSGFRHAT